jgi:hypothetical protein
VRIFLSAGQTARRYALPNLISGFEADVVDGSTHVVIEALDTATEGYTAHEPDDPRTREKIKLVGRPTGQTYKGFPWWEVQRED